MKTSKTHTCKLHCYSMDPEELDTMGMKDTGKWLDFSFLMDIVAAVKLTSDDEDQFTYGCTTLFTRDNDTYVIDTPFTEFLPKFLAYNGAVDASEPDL